MSVDRNDRLERDYREMLTIQNQPYLSWIAVKGDLPYAEEYLLTVRVRTYVFSMREKQCSVGAIRECTVKVTLWPSYPYVAPDIRMLSIPPVFHPAWYSRGVYCSPIPWQPDSSLKEYVRQMIRTLIYAPDLIDEISPANYKALDWYRKHRDNSAWFPSDTIELTESPAAEPDLAFPEVVDSWTVG